MSTLRPLEITDAERAGYSAAWIGPSGGDVHLIGLWEDGVLAGAARVAPMRRVRQSHAAEVRLHATTAAQADALLGEACRFADDWTAADRLQLTLPADAPAAEAAAAHAFLPEVQRVSRLETGRDEIVYGRLRPGFTSRPPGPPPPWPTRHRRATPEVSFRPIGPDDAAAVRDLSIEPTAVWGTLQTPWSNERYYTNRHETTGPHHEVVALIADGALSGLGGIHPTDIPEVYAMGMAVAQRWQGMGLGARLLDELLARAWLRGARRVELGVWEDNTRARALYASRGFQTEGLLRCDSIRAGGHASSLEMARSRS